MLRSKVCRSSRSWQDNNDILISYKGYFEFNLISNGIKIIASCQQVLSFFSLSKLCSDIRMPMVMRDCGAVIRRLFFVPHKASLHVSTEQLPRNVKAIVLTMTHRNFKDMAWSYNNIPGSFKLTFCLQWKQSRRNWSFVSCTLKQWYLHFLLYCVGKKSRKLSEKLYQLERHMLPKSQAFFYSLSYLFPRKNFTWRARGLCSEFEHPGVGLILY